MPNRLSGLIRRLFKREDKKQEDTQAQPTDDTPHDSHHEDAGSGTALAPTHIDLSPEGAPTEREDKFGLLPSDTPWGTTATAPEHSYPVDIVAIHGITGDAYDTWTHPSGVFWLRDLLPEDLPGARIFSYGYDADVFFTKSTGDIESFSQTFLESLKQRLMQGNNTRPIIFICHSMGGLVVKRAIVDSIVRTINYGDIQRLTYGIVFLGTPHRGSKQTPFPSLVASIANVSTPIISRFTGKARTDLINSLKSGAPGLEKLSSSFADQLARIKIASLIEQDITPPANSRIVDGVTGIVGCAGERVANMQGCNHQTICRFSGRNQNYRLIHGIIQGWAREATAHDNQAPQDDDSIDLIYEMEDTLAFEGMDWRRIELSDPAMRDRCTWILGHVTFQQWLEEPEGPLWIKGKPGTGKSTLMEELIEYYQPTSDAVVLHFFFVAFTHSQDKLRNSPQGLYRTLLYQLIEQYPKAVHDFNKFCRRQFRQHDRAGTRFEWHENDSNLIRDFLNKGLRNLAASDKSVKIFVDAIDEAYPGTAEELVMYLDQLDHTLRELGLEFRVCISSRHFPINYVVEKHRIVVENENSSDIENYIRSEFERRNILMMPHLVGSQLLNQLRADIIAQSNGIFLWVTRIMPEVVEQLNRAPDRFHPVYDALREVPPELGKIYVDMLQNIIQPMDRYDSYLLFQWATKSADPMLIRQLYSDVQFSDAYSLPANTTSADLARERLKTDIRLGRLSGGLMECLDNIEEVTAAFIHFSVRDFLSDFGLSLLGSMIPLPPDTESSTSSSTEDFDETDRFPVDNATQRDHGKSHASNPEIASKSSLISRRSSHSLHTATGEAMHMPTGLSSLSAGYSLRADELKKKAADKWFSTLESNASRFLQGQPKTKRVRIAILDTGLNMADPIFSTRTPRVQGIWNLDGSRNVSDTDGHGTNIASILLKLAPSADLYIGRVWDSSQNTVPWEAVANALMWAVEAEADIISMGFGIIAPLHQPPSLTDALRAIAHRGVPVFVPASTADQLPQPNPREVITIHSADGYGNTSSFNPPARIHQNNFTFLGEQISVGSKTMSGTSFATAIAAGIAAMILTYARNNLHLSEQSVRLLSEREGMETVFQYMSSSRYSSQGYDYVVPWKLFTGTADDAEIAHKLNLILESC